MYLVTCGGNDKMTLAVWKIKELLDQNIKEKGGLLKNALPICEYVVGKT